MARLTNMNGAGLTGSSSSSIVIIIIAAADAAAAGEVDGQEVRVDVSGLADHRADDLIVEDAVARAEDRQAIRAEEVRRVG